MSTFSKTTRHYTTVVTGRKVIEVQKKWRRMRTRGVLHSRQTTASSSSSCRSLDVDHLRASFRPIDQPWERFVVQRREGTVRSRVQRLCSTLVPATKRTTVCRQAVGQLVVTASVSSYRVHKWRQICRRPRRENLLARRWRRPPRRLPGAVAVAVVSEREAQHLVVRPLDGFRSIKARRRRLGIRVGRILDRKREVGRLQRGEWCNGRTRERPPCACIVCDEGGDETEKTPADKIPSGVAQVSEAAHALTHAVGRLDSSRHSSDRLSSVGIQQLTDE